MKFQHKIKFKGKLSNDEIKNGFEKNKGQFDDLKPGEQKVVGRDEIFGKFSNGKHYVKVLTGWERFDEIKEEKQ